MSDGDGFDIRKAAEEAFREKRGELLSFDVPQWGTEARVYYYPKLTVAEWEIFGPHLRSNMVTASTLCFMCSARDKDGNRLWQPTVAHDWVREHIDYEDIMYVVGRMGFISFGEDNEPAEETAKKT